jgi:ClpP class serine protease
MNMISQYDAVALAPGFDRMLDLVTNGSHFADSCISRESAIRNISTIHDRESISSVAIVPIRGIMWRGAGGVPGFCDTGMIARYLDELPDEVDTVILDMHSPGGLVAGTPELAAAVARAGQHRLTIAWIDYLCCSAAYWVAAAADQIWALPSGRLGSIGAMLTVRDYSRQLRDDGVDEYAFASARGKLRGVRPVTPEDEAHWQAGVDRAGEQFRRWVTARRPGIDEVVFGGDTYDGDQAGELGLVDGLADTLAEALLSVYGLTNRG